MNANIIEKYVEKVYGYAVGHTYSREEADDLSQEILFTAVRELPKLKDADKFEPWLWGIANNVTKCFRRQMGKKRALYSYDIPEDIAYEEDSDDDKEALNQIDSMLGDTYGVQTDRQMIGDSLYQVNGTLDGEAVYGSYRDGAGFLSYSGKQIGDVTVCGIYPGMSEEEAKKKLEASGFYWDTYNYVSGELDNNYYVTLYLENGTVQSIQFGLTINW